MYLRSHRSSPARLFALETLANSPGSNNDRWRGMVDPDNRLRGCAFSTDSISCRSKPGLATVELAPRIRRYRDLVGDRLLNRRQKLDVALCISVFVFSGGGPVAGSNRATGDSGSNANRDRD